MIGNEGIKNTTDCLNSACDCATTAIKSQEGKCYLDKKIGEVCKESMECSISIAGGECDTSTSKCVCSVGTQGDIGSKVCSKPGAASTLAKLEGLSVALSVVSIIHFLKFN
jgi:hypothetical protein